MARQPDLNMSGFSDMISSQADIPMKQAPVAVKAAARVVDEMATQVRNDFIAFLSSYHDENSHFYIEQIKSLREHQKTTVYVDYQHLVNFDETLAQTISVQYFRMEPYLRKAIQSLVKEYDPEYLSIDTGRAADGETREFWLGWLREVRMSSHGQLLSISGTVTRTSEVRPELLFGTFACGDCGSVIRDVEQEFKYTEECGNRTSFNLLTEQSKFADWQKVRIQENSNQVPSGAMPRSMDVIFRNEAVEKAKAGDRVIITGTAIVVPDVGQLIGNKIQARRDAVGGRGRDGFTQEGVTGLKSLGVRDLTYKLVFLGSFVQNTEMKNALNALHDLIDDDDVTERLLLQFSEEQLNEIQAMKNDRRVYQKLAGSICPHIYGHEDIKKGVLLQILGGVHKSTPEGIRLRGDINVCIVGDPSTAKSQFLKYVTSFMPRAIYTSGKASSAAGLTASVVKDEETGEFTIEAGALMLADNGICCIDEFDKMDISDQVAIHEAMEQQTISITKAGIQATLNARTSILAAANPIHGRYDKKLSLKQNIAMSPPIMSRFDLFFIILDECHEQTDLGIAQHIVNFHRFKDQGIKPDYTTDQLQMYLTYARGLKPQLTEEAKEYLVTQYRNLRQADASGISRSSYRITVRQLESMIRLSEALAKLYGNPEILVAHVTEAAHLLQTSIVHVEEDAVDLEADDDMAQQVMRPDEVGLEDVPMEVDTQLESAIEGATPAKQIITLTAEEYHKIIQSLILQIRRHERETSTTGMTRSQIINWYMETLEDAGEINTEADVSLHRKKIKSVLSRMIKKENILLELQDETRVDLDTLEIGTSEDPVLVISPSYYIESED